MCIYILHFNATSTCSKNADMKSPVDIYLFKINHGNSRKIYDICSKLTIKTSKRRHELLFLVKSSKKLQFTAVLMIGLKLSIPSTRDKTFNNEMRAQIFATHLNFTDIAICKKEKIFYKNFASLLSSLRVSFFNSKD